MHPPRLQALQQHQTSPPLSGPVRARAIMDRVANAYDNTALSFKVRTDYCLFLTLALVKEGSCYWKVICRTKLDRQTAEQMNKWTDRKMHKQTNVIASHDLMPCPQIHLACILLLIGSPVPGLLILTRILSCRLVTLFWSQSRMRTAYGKVNWMAGVVTFRSPMSN